MDKQINLDEVFFHSLEPFGEFERSKKSFKKLEAVLKNGNILSRQLQLEQNKNNESMQDVLSNYLDEKHNYNWNGMHHISICKKSSDENANTNSNAFDEYVAGNAGIGIILSKEVANLIDNERTEVMDGEFQIPDKIPLEYMVGIFCGGKSCNEITNDILQAKNSGISNNEIKQVLPHILVENQIENCQKINILLNNYGYTNTPIYSTRDGYEIGDVQNLIENFGFQDLCE